MFTITVSKTCSSTPILPSVIVTNLANRQNCSYFVRYKMNSHLFGRLHITAKFPRQSPIIPLEIRQKGFGKHTIYTLFPNELSRTQSTPASCAKAPECKLILFI